MNQLMMRFANAILLSALFFDYAIAWIASPATLQPKRLMMRSSLAASHEDQPLRSVSDELSRRKWSVNAVAAFSGLFVGLPAFAAPSIVSSTAVCDPTVSVWQRKNRLVYLLGTAHISEASANLAGQLVRDVHPSAVFVELDLKRVGGRPPQANQIVTTRLEFPTGNPSSSSKVIVPNIATSSQKGAMVASGGGRSSVSADAISDQSGGRVAQRALGVGASAVGGAIRGLYKNLDNQGVKAGQEFVRAIEEGQKINADIVLGDRDVEVTLRRLTTALSQTDLSKLLNPNSEVNKGMQELMPAPAAGKKTTELDDFTNYVESIKTRENVRRIMSQLREVAPALVEVMLTERDVYMATGLDTLNDKEVTCAVMGIAHQDGVEANLMQFGWKQVSPRCPKKFEP